jgi:hypothetical protein
MLQAYCSSHAILQIACEVVVSLKVSHKLCCWLPSCDRQRHAEVSNIRVTLSVTGPVTLAASWGVVGCAHNMVLPDDDDLRNLWCSTYDAGVASAACLGSLCSLRACLPAGLRCCCC